MAGRRPLTSAITTSVPGVAPKQVKAFVEQDDNSATGKSRFQPVGLIPVTIRLRPEIAGALKRASLERELNGKDVFTQQDIVERALEPWLRQEGVL